MKDKDKLLLLFNIYVGKLHGLDVADYLNTVAKNLSDFFDDSVKCIFAPTWNDNKPFIQAITDFPWTGCEIILQMEELIKDKNYEELSEVAKSLCEFAKAYQNGETEYE